MEAVRITFLAPAGSSDKGARTFNDRYDKPLAQMTWQMRGPDDAPAPHYHEGTDPAKRPEILMILSGRVRFIAWLPEGHIICNEALEVFGQFIRIEIAPQVRHVVIFDTSVTLAECRSTLFDPQQTDTYLTEWHPDLRRNADSDPSEITPPAREVADIYAPLVPQLAG